MIEIEQQQGITEEELIRREFECLLDDYRNSNHRQKFEIITKAFQFANSAHKGMRRRSGEPYILHPLAVARIVVREIGLGSTSICAALLHDVVEDTEYTVEDIEKLFTPKIAQLVDGLTKISGGVFAEHASEQAENFRKLLLTMSEDIRVVLIKTADRLHNMRTLGSMPPAKQYKIAGETNYIYAPLAHRLGLFRIKIELENLSFKYEHPDKYAEIEKKLAVDEQERLAFFAQFTTPIRELLRSLGYEFFFKERVKSVYSIWKKMNQKNIPFEDVFDLLALRIVFDPKQGLSEKDQCWMLYSALTELYKPHPQRIRDWVSHPKANGYEALHGTLMGHDGRWVEVQIRSRRMNDIAEKGLAAHYKYKSGESDESELEKWMKTIKEMLENPEPNAIDFLDTFKLNLFASEIFVFTPSGEIKTIAMGATALDFAFSLHSDLGMRCIGAKVNHKLVPLSYVLQSGDQVEIITTKKQAPMPEWLNYVSTARAKSKLKAYFKREEKNYIYQGQRLIEMALAARDIKPDNEIMVKLLNHYNLSERNSMYLKAGKGQIDVAEIARISFKTKQQNVLSKYLKLPFVGSSESKKPAVVVSDSDKPSKIDRATTIVLTEQHAGTLYYIASCCNPIPGDDVLGFVDENEYLHIHKRNCPKVAKLKSSFGKQLVSVKWATNKGLSFIQTLEIKGIDKKGVMIEILKVISEKFGGNISKINIETNDGIFIGHFSVYVHDTEDVENLCRNIRLIPEVTSSQRLE